MRRSLKLLLDENMGKTIVVGLRSAGFHVQSVAEEARGAADEEVVALAKERNKIILTQDKDFGRLALSMDIPGLILVRLRARQEVLLNHLVGLLKKPLEFYGYITVLELGRIRRRPL